MGGCQQAPSSPGPTGAKVVARSPEGRYFLAAGFALSCLGFLFFLSFFWEWLPLPMEEAPCCGGISGRYYSVPDAGPSAKTLATTAAVRPEQLRGFTPAPRVDRPSLSHAVSKKLSQAIVAGEFKPGSKISEPTLSSMLGVSRAPIEPVPIFDPARVLAGQGGQMHP